MTGNPAFIIDNPTVCIGPAGADATNVVTCELTRASITNDANMVDTGSLCGPMNQPGKIEYTLELEGYQAWGGTPVALAEFLWDNAREQVPFKLIPKNEVVSATNPAFEGIVVCVPTEVGGTREEAATFTVALPIIGQPTKSATDVLGTTFAAPERESAVA